MSQHYIHPLFKINYHKFWLIIRSYFLYAHNSLHRNIITQQISNFILKSCWKPLTNFLNSTFHWMSLIHSPFQCSYTHNSRVISYNYYLTGSITSVNPQTNAIFILEAEVTSTCSQKTCMVPLIKQHYYGCVWLWYIIVVFHSSPVFCSRWTRRVPRSFRRVRRSRVFRLTDITWDLAVHGMVLRLVTSVGGSVFTFTGWTSKRCRSEDYGFALLPHIASFETLLSHLLLSWFCPMPL